MAYHTKLDTGGWRCEATGLVATQLWTDRAKRAREGHYANECIHCAPGHKTIGDMLHDLNEKAKRETQKRKR